MITKNSRSVLKKSLFSILILGVFFILATGSLDFLFLLDIQVEKDYLGDGIYRETETHYSNRQEVTWEGPQDDKGRWNGWITIEYYKRNYDVVYVEHVYMLKGRRQGLCTRTYPDGKVVEEHYINGIKVDLKKAAGSDPAAGSAFGMIQDRQPWFLFALEAFGFDKQYTEHFLDTTETLLGTYTFSPEEFVDYYEQVMDTLSKTPYDSIIQSNHTMAGSIGFRNMKDDQLRLAVIDRYRAEGSNTFSILESTYPNYILEMSAWGVAEADLMQFCSDMDDTLNMLGGLDLEDPFFVDSVDSRFSAAVNSFMNTEESVKKAASLKQGVPGRHVTRDLRLVLSKTNPIKISNGSATTPAEVAEIVMMLMIYKYLDGDLIRFTVNESYMAHAGIPHLPGVATQFAADNSATSATVHGYVLSDGGAEVTARGIAWADFYDPTITDNTETAGSGTGQFSITLSGLTEGTTYYARAYATNSAGTAYGNLVSFVAGSTVSIEEFQGESTRLSIYPNPASSDLLVEFHAPTSSRIEILLFDAAGRLVEHKKTGTIAAGKHETRIDVSGLPVGIYHCRLLQNGIPVATGEIIIAR